MAASVSPSSRGTSKRLLLITSLLCLVYVATSHTSNDELEILKERYLKKAEALKRMKAEHEQKAARISKVFDDAMEQFDPVVELAEEFIEEFPPMSGLLKVIERFWEGAKNYTDSKMESFSAQIVYEEEELRELEKLIKLREKQKHRTEL